MPTDKRWPISAFGPYRFAPYLSKCDGDLVRALDLYQLNIQLSSALFEQIAVIEVVLRNRTIEALERKGEPWLKVLSRFVELPTGIKRETGQVSGMQIPNSQLSFGFWRRLYSKQFESRLWAPYLSRTPGATSRPNRTFVSQRLDSVWKLRNRIAHHESLIEVDLEVSILSIEELLEYLGAEVSKYAAKMNRSYELVGSWHDFDKV